MIMKVFENNPVLDQTGHRPGRILNSNIPSRKYCWWQTITGYNYSQFFSTLSPYHRKEPSQYELYSSHSVWLEQLYFKTF